jgi:catechol 2,3-dioxygenase-like lactoylglutathione lyase family enzyme
MRKRPAIPRLDGGPQTVLLVDDVERTAVFYAQTVLLERRDGDTGRFAEFDTGDGGVLVIVKRDGSIAPMAADAAAGEGATLTFGITNEGFDTWKKWFGKCGVPIERDAKWVHGGRSLFVRDPDGRRLEFKTPRAVVPPPAPVVITERKREE